VNGVKLADILFSLLFVCLSVCLSVCTLSPIVSNGDFVELSFGVVSGVGPGIRVLDGVHVLQGKGLFWGFFGICVPIGLNEQNDVLFAEKCIRLVCEKLTVFPYGQDIVGNAVLLAFW